jgi:hypothetical protein
MSIHPFGDLHIEGSGRDRQVIEATLKRFEELGTQAWVGYSFSWFSCMLSRALKAEDAYRYLDIFVRAFILRSGFHVNGDQLRAGFSGFTYRPFTLEGNFLASQAVHEMVLQSWGGTIRVFPSMPWRWHDAEFEDLRAEGGWKVSARRDNNHTTWIRVEAVHGGQLRLRDNFGGRSSVFSRNDVTKRGDDWVVALRAGATLEVSFRQQPEIPPKPANAAEPLRPPKHIRPNKLPLRIGADSTGGSRFTGDIARVSVFSRALLPREVATLAETQTAAPGQWKGCVASWDFSRRTDKGFLAQGAGRLLAGIVGDVEIVEAGGGLGKALRLDGGGFLNTPHQAILDCPDGVTLEAWIRPGRLPPRGARIIDKTPVGGATAYLLDTYPGNSLRLIFRNPHVTYDAKLAVNRWAHVAATVDGETGHACLYLNGKLVAEQ